MNLASCNLPRSVRLGPPLWAAALLLFIASGCGGGDEHLYDDYGSRRSYEQSINGTDALANLFRRQGHQVRSWRFLSPSLERADVLVWFPDDLEPPTTEVQYWLENWLTSTPVGSPPRVLVYVGRDYTAAPLYWQSVQPQAPAEVKGEYQKRLNQAEADAANLRDHRYERTECPGWFDIVPPTKPEAEATSPVAVTSLRGRWAEGIDSSKVQIEANAHLVPEPPFVALLADPQGRPLASEHRFETYTGYAQPDGRLILIENGSWLVNGALVNRDHRKLAGKLVTHVGPPRLSVVFLESDAGGPPIRDTDPSGAPPTGLALFRVWPIGPLLLQAAALGILFAFMRWPLFGPPRRLSRRSLTDFGSHIQALGRMLAEARNRRHAIETVRLYWKTLDRKSASAARDVAPPLLTPSETTKL